MPHSTWPQPTDSGLPSKLDGGRAAAPHVDRRRRQIGPHLARVGLEPLQQERAQPLPPTVDAEGAATVHVGQARLRDGAGLRQIAGEGGRQPHQRAQRMIRRQRRAQVAVVVGEPRADAVGVAPIPDSLGRQNQILREDGFERVGDLAHLRRQRVHLRGRFGQLTRHLARRVVADVDAMIGQDQLERRAIGLQPPPQELHQIELADHPLQRRALHAHKGQRRARQVVRADRVALLDRHPGSQHAEAAMRQHRAGHRRCQIAAQDHDVVEALRHGRSAYHARKRSVVREALPNTRHQQQRHHCQSDGQAPPKPARSQPQRKRQPDAEG